MPLSLRVLLVPFLAYALPACAAEPAPVPVQSSASMETEDQKILYALGQVLGRNVQGADLSEAEMESVLLGLADSALGREPRVDLARYGPMLQAFMQQRAEAAAAVELTASTAFLDEQAGMAGAVRTESGIVIQEITAGDGARPEADDIVRVHYHGTLRNGSVFDSSVDRGEPATFPLNQVIPCWTEGVQSIQVGGKSRLVCPPDLAYGTSAPPGIPANAALVFEVELLEIVGN